MRARAAALALVALAFGAVFGAPAGAQTNGEVRLTELGEARFPARSFLLTLPNSVRLSAGDITVLENGRPATRISLEPANALGQGGVAIVLAIDTSNSMRGEAIADAMEAARVFAARRKGNQQLAVVTFDGDVRTLLPFTRSESDIDAALNATPPLAQGTRLYDGVSHALGLIRASGARFGSVVVLSDGADTGSDASSGQVIQKANRAHFRLFSVALGATASAQEKLELLAQGTNGLYAEAATSTDLAGIFGELGSLLSNEYVLSYLSLSEPRRAVDVSVGVRGYEGRAQQSYVSPALPDVDEAIYHTSLAFRFWTGPLSMALTSWIAALLIATGFVVLLLPRNRSLRRRMAEFVTLGFREPEANEDVVAGGQPKTGSIESTDRWARFLEALDVARIKMPATHIVLLTLAGTVFAMWVLVLLGGSPLFALLGLFVPLAVRGGIRHKLKGQRRQFEGQLADNLQVMASALRAGHSFIGAMSVVVDDSPEPSRREFQSVIRDEQLGIPLESALETVVRRMKSRELEQVALVAALQRESGGNTAEVLDRVVETVRERSELRRLIRTLTAQGRLARWVVSLLPLGLLVVITFLNPSFTEPLFTQAAGRLLLAFATAMIIVGSLVIKKIVEIEV